VIAAFDGRKEKPSRSAVGTSPPPYLDSGKFIYTQLFGDESLVRWKDIGLFHE
jgi:hypothetical protein